MKGIIFTFLLTVISYIGFSQTITGKVTDNYGNPLSGVSVVSSISGIGTSTNELGVYSINLADTTGEIIFSFVGFKEARESIAGRKEINKIMEEDFGDLSEVVVVGYGTQKKENLSGAVYQVDKKSLESRPIANISQGLQGMVPNLNIMFNSGAPGEAASINIRGITSINGGNPLILIDGVPSSSSELNMLAPQDVENLTVIKDASAAAIYGARASFGVILITTKSGSKGGINVNYLNNLSIHKQTVIPDKVTDPYIFSRLLELSTDNTPWDNVNYSDQFYQFAKERSDNPSVPGVRINPTSPDLWEYMGNKDWTRYFMKDNFFTQNHSISVSGISEDKKADYYLSVGYNDQKSPLALSKDVFNRMSLRSKVNYQLTNWLSIGNNTFIANTGRERPRSFNLFNTYAIFPTSFDKNPDGTWANSDAGRMAAQLMDGGDVTDKTLNTQSTFSGELTLFNSMVKINANYTIQKMNRHYNSFSTKYMIGYGPNDIREEGNSYDYKYSALSDYNIFDVYGTFSNKWNKHSLTVILGYNTEDYYYEDYEVQKNDLISSSYPTIALATGITTGNASANSYSIIGTFYRLNYIFNSKYIFELNGRYDGSSRFPQDKRFGFFPSASIAWRMDQEDFIRNIAFISELKPRISYGELGNQTVSNFGYIPSMSMYQAGYLIGGQRPNAITAPPLVSDNYTWEKVNTLNFGLDFAFFSNKLSGSFDIYRRNTIGMLTKGKDLPNILGAAEPNENAADLKTTGWEISLSYRNSAVVLGSLLNYSATFLLADSRSWITKFDNPSNSILQYYKGMELGEIWGLQSNGLFTSEADIKALDQSSIIPWGALQIVPGWPKYIDRDGNGKIEKGYTLDDTKDLVVIGNYNPRYRYGVDLNMEWKGIDLRIFLQGVGKRDYYPSDYLYWGFYQQPYGSTYAHLLDFYRPDSDSDIDRAKHSQSYINAGLADQNHDAKFPILQSWLADVNLGPRIDGLQGTAIPQTGYMQNAAYLRLKNLTIGYTLKTGIIEKAGIKSLRVFLSGENITEWSSIKKYFDPESVNANIYTSPGIGSSRNGNGMVYPFLRTYSFGVNINF